MLRRRRGPRRMCGMCGGIHRVDRLWRRFRLKNNSIASESRLEDSLAKALGDFLPFRGRSRRWLGLKHDFGR